MDVYQVDVTDEELRVLSAVREWSDDEFFVAFGFERSEA